MTRIHITIYTKCKEVVVMDTAKVFENGRSQAVRLPKKFRFNVDEVIVQQLGDAVLLAPKESVWKIFMDGLDGFTSDIFDGGRDQGVQQEREIL
ncbi:MAG: antitoxin [Bacteroidales bacterium]